MSGLILDVLEIGPKGLVLESIPGKTVAENQFPDQLRSLSGFPLTPHGATLSQRKDKSLL